MRQWNLYATLRIDFAQLGRQESREKDKKDSDDSDDEKGGKEKAKEKEKKKEKEKSRKEKEKKEKEKSKKDKKEKEKDKEKDKDRDKEKSRKRARSSSSWVRSTEECGKASDYVWLCNALHISSSKPMAILLLGLHVVQVCNLCVWVHFMTRGEV